MPRRTARQPGYRLPYLARSAGAAAAAPRDAMRGRGSRHRRARRSALRRSPPMRCRRRAARARKGSRAQLAAGYVLPLSSFAATLPLGGGGGTPSGRNGPAWNRAGRGRKTRQTRICASLVEDSFRTIAGCAHDLSACPSHPWDRHPGGPDGLDRAGVWLCRSVGQPRARGRNLHLRWSEEDSGQRRQLRATGRGARFRALPVLHAARAAVGSAARGRADAPSCARRPRGRTGPPRHAALPRCLVKRAAARSAAVVLIA